jgi:hypothetical protein
MKWFVHPQFFWCTLDGFVRCRAYGASIYSIDLWRKALHQAALL